MTPDGASSNVSAIATELKGFARDVESLRAAVGAVFLGNPEVLDQVLWSFLAGGHVLLESVPGLGKTTLVKTFARALGMEFARVQFTPDLMPADILGLRVLEEDPSGQRRFHFQRGPVFAHVLLADEINRATPRTQSALLEAMQEEQVTLHGEAHPLPDPFFLVATENPIEMEGTWPLPEAQLDRFLFKVWIESPSTAALLQVLSATSGAGPAEVAPVLDAERARRLRALVREVPTSSEILERVARLVRATHPDAEEAPEEIRRHVRHGASPRGAQACLWTARARALCAGRVHVTHEDVEAVARPALRHRLILSYEGIAADTGPDALVERALEASRP